MYQITIKYKDGTEKVILDPHYDKACTIANNCWCGNIKSAHVKEIK